MADRKGRNAGIIDEFRAHEGRVGGPFEGAPLLLLITTGARSGRTRVNPLMYLADGDRLVVFASKGGSPTNPDWYHNVVANPDASVEVGTGHFPVRATVATGARTRRTLRRAGEAVSAVREVRGEHPASDPRRRSRTHRVDGRVSPSPAAAPIGPGALEIRG
jgi:deazaflavin-dependent oxidoreductase (nitroreductase family)